MKHLLVNLAKVNPWDKLNNFVKDNAGALLVVTIVGVAVVALLVIIAKKWAKSYAKKYNNRKKSK